MRYNKYVEMLYLRNVTSEPTEQDIYFTFSPTVRHVKQNNANYILIVFFSCFSGLLLFFTCVIKAYKLKYKKKFVIKPNYEYNEFDNFGTQNILDDV